MSQKQTSVGTCVWTGASGKEYTYFIYPVDAHFTDHEPGNYIFARHDSNNRATAVYIGQTEDLSERFDNHHAMPCISRNGATHLHAHINRNGLRARLDEETDLRSNHNTPCNLQ